eukprot:TRINITY_DN11106_c0_g1_i1.p1 TRINITY_DN11106_c0_g1~~TRINITY_DN11106_c0_g1_i1.p1  ORF type:complete len:2399 (+),score=811.62 TRINITY_DN11106_c0_g1_i1:158-7354(+)
MLRDDDESSIRSMASYLVAATDVGEIPPLPAGLIAASGSGFHAVGGVEATRKKKKGTVGRGRGTPSSPALSSPASPAWQEEYARVTRPHGGHPRVHHTTPAHVSALPHGATHALHPAESALALPGTATRSRPRSAAPGPCTRTPLPARTPSAGQKRSALRVRLLRDLPSDYFLATGPSPGVSPTASQRPSPTWTRSPGRTDAASPPLDDARSPAREDHIYSEHGLQFTPWSITQAKVMRYQHDRSAVTGARAGDREDRWHEVRQRQADAHASVARGTYNQAVRAKQAKYNTRQAKWAVVEQQNALACEETHARRKLRKEASRGWWRLAQTRWRGCVDIASEAARVDAVEEEALKRLEVATQELCAFEANLRRLLYKDFVEQHHAGVREAHDEYRVHLDYWERKRRWQSDQDQQCHRFFNQEGLKRDQVAIEEAIYWEKVLNAHAAWQEEMRNAEMQRRRQRQEAFLEQQRQFARDRAAAEYEETMVRPKVRMEEVQARQELANLAEKSMEEVKGVLRRQFEERMLALRAQHRAEQQPLLDEEQRLREDIAEESMYAANILYLHYLEGRDVIVRPVRLTVPESCHHVCRTESFCAAGSTFRMRKQFNPYLESRAIAISMEFGIVDGYVPGDSVGLLRLCPDRVRQGAKLVRFSRATVCHHARVSGRDDEYKTWEESEHHRRAHGVGSDGAEGAGALDGLNGFHLEIPQIQSLDSPRGSPRGGALDDPFAESVHHRPPPAQPSRRPDATNRWVRVDMVINRRSDIVRDMEWFLQKLQFRPACDAAPWTPDADLRDRVFRVQITLSLTPTFLEKKRGMKYYQCTLEQEYTMRVLPPFFLQPMFYKHLPFHLEGDYVVNGQRTALAFFEKLVAYHPERDAAGCTLHVAMDGADGDSVVLKGKGNKLTLKEHPKTGKIYVTTGAKDLCEVTQGSLAGGGANSHELAFKFSNTAKQKQVHTLLKALRFVNQQKTPERPRRCVTMTYTETHTKPARQVVEKVWMNIIMPEDAGPTILVLGPGSATMAMVYRPLFGSQHQIDARFEPYLEHYHMPLAPHGFVENQHSLGCAEFEYARFAPGSFFFKVDQGVQLGDMLTLRPLAGQKVRQEGSVLFIDVPNRSIAFNGIHVAKYTLEIGGAHSVGTYEGATSPAWLRVEINKPLTEQELSQIVRSLHFTNKAQKVVNGVRWISGTYVTEDPAMPHAPPAKTRAGLRVCLPVMVLPMRHQSTRYTEGEGSRRFGTGFEIPDPVFKDDDIVSVYDGGSIRVQIVQGLNDEDVIGLAEDPKFYEVTALKRKQWSLRFNGSQTKSVGRFTTFNSSVGTFQLNLGTAVDRRQYVDIKQKKPHATKVRKRELLLLLKNLYYRNDSDDPTELRKVIKVTITDAFGAFSVSVMEVNIRAVNNKTVLTFPSPTTLDFRKSGWLDHNGFQVAQGVTFTDPDTYEFKGGCGYIAVALCSGGGRFDSLDILPVEQQRRWPGFREENAVHIAPRERGGGRRGSVSARNFNVAEDVLEESVLSAPGDDKESSGDPAEPKLFDVFIGDALVGSLEKKVCSGGTALHFSIALPRRWIGFTAQPKLASPAPLLGKGASGKKGKGVTSAPSFRKPAAKPSFGAMRRLSLGSADGGAGSRRSSGQSEGPPYGLPLAAAQLLLQSVVYKNVQEPYAVKPNTRTYLVRVNAGDDVEDTTAKVNVKTLPPLLSVPRLKDVVQYVEGSGYQPICQFLKSGLTDHDTIRRGFLRVRIAEGFVVEQDELALHDRAGKCQAQWTKVPPPPEPKPKQQRKRSEMPPGSPKGSPRGGPLASPRGAGLHSSRPSPLRLDQAARRARGGSTGSVGSVASMGSNGMSPRSPPPMSPSKRRPADRRKPPKKPAAPPATHRGKLVDQNGMAIVGLLKGVGWVQMIFDQPTPVSVKALYDLLKLVCYRNESALPDTTVRVIECEFVWSDTPADDEHGPKADAVDGSTPGFDSALVRWNMEIEDFDNPTDVELPHLALFHVVASCGASLRPLQLCPKALATDPDTQTYPAHSALIFQVIGGNKDDLVDLAPDGLDAPDNTDPLPAPWIKLSLIDDSQIVARKVHDAVQMGSSIPAEVAVKVGCLHRDLGHASTLTVDLHGCPVELLQFIIRRVYYRSLKSVRKPTPKQIQLTVKGGGETDTPNKKEALTRVNMQVTVTPAPVDYVGRAGATFIQTGPAPLNLLPPTAKVNLSAGGTVRFELLLKRDIPETLPPSPDGDEPLLGASSRFWYPYLIHMDLTAENLKLFRSPTKTDLLRLLPMPTEIGTMEERGGALLVTWGKQRLCRVIRDTTVIDGVETCHAITIVFEAADPKTSTAARDQQLVKVLRSVAYALNENAGVPMPPAFPATSAPEGSAVLLMKLTQTLPVPKPQQSLLLVDYLTIRPKPLVDGAS